MPIDTIQAKKRKENINRCFSTPKVYHGFRYTNMKEMEKMRIKSTLTFACLNMKKLANILCNTDSNRTFFINQIDKDDKHKDKPEIIL